MFFLTAPFRERRATDRYLSRRATGPPGYARARRILSESRRAATTDAYHETVLTGGRWPRRRAKNALHSVNHPDGETALMCPIVLAAPATPRQIPLRYPRRRGPGVARRALALPARRGSPGAPGANTARSAPDAVGDLRYDRSPGLDFSELPLDRAAPCPKRVPP